MPDLQIPAPGTKAAPLVYTVPGSVEMIVKAAFATFNGTGAGGAFLPCLRVLSPAGLVVGEYVTDSSVAAGSSAEVSFAPFLRASAGATPAAASGLPNCVRTDQTGQTIAHSTESLIVWHDFPDFGTTDAVLFQEDAFAANTIYITETGLYLAWWHVDFGTFPDPQLVAAGLRWADHGALWPQISPQRLVDTDSGINGQYSAGNTPDSSYYLDVISYAYISNVGAPGATLKVFFNNLDPVNAADLAAYVLTVCQIMPITAADLAGFPSFHF